MTTNHKPATALQWTRAQGPRGYKVYVRGGRLGPMTIDRRFRWSYLGGGRQGSVQQWYIEYGNDGSGPFKTLREAQTAGDALLRDLGES